MAKDYKATILVVDDEPDVLKVLAKRLDTAGYNVLTASGGNEALALLDKEIPDLIILDIIMPEIDGIEVCRKIKKQKYMTDIPIIFFTARGTIEEKVKGLEEDVYDYITKPIDHEELLARVNAVLRIHDNYNRISLIDGLTGLYNYNFFEKQFTHSFDLAKRYGRIFSLIVTDIDDFKQLNDAHGHLCGNMVLKKVSEILKKTLRKVDVICRYGGDEFSVILPETDCAQAQETVQRLRNAQKEAGVSYKGNPISFRLSLGFATYSEEIKTKEDFFNLADQNMYEDKRKKSG